MSSKRGHLLPIILITIGVSSIVMFSLAMLVVNQFNLTQRQTAIEQARQIAESGLSYYRWRISHFPNDYTNGTGQPGPYLVDYFDPEGNAIGKYSLQITPPQPGRSTITIQSTGWMNEYPDIRQIVEIQYGQASLAEFALLYDSDIWLPPGFTINGPVHSNGGIRNDGTNTSQVSSSLAQYSCTQKNGGCQPKADKPGVWGNGGDKGLWIYPAPRVDFDSITIDYVSMKTQAQANGLYLPPTNGWGYHLIFNNNGTITVRRVTQVDNFKGGKGNPGCDQLYGSIKNEVQLSAHQQNSIPIIFVEDNVWVEGTITSPLTITAAKFPTGSNSADIWINNNIVYQNKNGSIQLGLIAQKDIVIHRDIPTDLEINGALLSQTGSILRHDYGVSCAGNPANALRNSLTLYGALISSQTSQWNWGTSLASGFQTGTITYDSNLRFTPPPYFPTNQQFEIIDWN